MVALDDPSEEFVWTAGGRIVDDELGGKEKIVRVRMDIVVISILSSFQQYAPYLSCCDMNSN